MSTPLSNAAAMRALWVAAWTGVAARVVLVFLSTGSNDIVLWQRYGQSIAESGLAALYRQEILFNHPPLMGLWAAAVTRIAPALGVPFVYIFKAPSVAADILALLVIARSWRERAGGRTA